MIFLIECFCDVKNNFIVLKNKLTVSAISGINFRVNLKRELKCDLSNISLIGKKKANKSNWSHYDNLLIN